MRLLMSCLALMATTGILPAGETPPLRQRTAGWPAGHLQGVAVDLERGHLYYSFTTLLAKYDFKGRLLGTLGGWSGHLGDLDFNPADGHVYGSLEYKKASGFYVAVIDVARIDRPGLDARATGILRTVFLPEVAADYAADLDGDGVFAGDNARTADHRYGCSGIDGVSFGPRFGTTSGPRLLTVAYGVYANPERNDNDHQVLLQYDVAGWKENLRPLSEPSPSQAGGAKALGKYFVRTGNTTYGVQNLAYDGHLGRWFLGAYAGTKPAFPNYRLFAIDAGVAPRPGRLLGVGGANGAEEGLLLALADAGMKDERSGVRGWRQKADVGLQPVGGGLCYVGRNFADGKQQSGEVILMRWTGEPAEPFVPATAEEAAQATGVAR